MPTVASLRHSTPLPIDAHAVHLYFGFSPSELIDGELEVTQNVQLFAASGDQFGMVVNDVGVPWGQLPQHVDPEYYVPWQASRHLDKYWQASWDAPKALDVEFGIAWSQLRYVDPERTVSWDQLFRLERELTLVWAQPPAKDAQYALPWGELAALDVSFGVGYHYPPARDKAYALLWGVLKTVDPSFGIPYHYPPPKERRSFSVPWDQARVVEGTYFPYVRPPVVEEPEPPKEGYVTRGLVCLNFDRPLSPSNLSLRFNRTRPETCFDRVFIVNNTVSVITLLDNQPLEVKSVTIGTDASSFAWAVDIEVPRLAELNRIKPTGAGPKEIEVTINGYVWRAIVESVSNERAFGKWRYTARARTFSVYAAAPYANQISGVNDADMTAEQLALAALTPLDFTLTWQAMDWVVGAGLLRYDSKDPIGILSQLATAVGGVVIPSRFDKSFTVKSRYKLSPWEWASALPTELDATITLNYQIQANTTYEPNPAYDVVWVSGTTEGSYIVEVKRAGFGSEKEAPSVTDPLLNTLEVNVERGRVELSKGGNRSSVSVVTPLVSAVTTGPRLRTPMDFIEVDDEEGAWRGLVTGVRISVQRGDKALHVFQTLEVERYHG